MNVDPRDKRKSISVVQLDEEKKKQQAIKIERQRQINSILRQQANYQLGLNKGDPNKQWCYEIIKQIVAIGSNDELRKVPKKSYDTENSDFNLQKFIVFKSSLRS